MNARTLFSTVLAGVSLAATPALLADNVVLTQNGYSYYNGGEFNTVTSPTSYLGNYSPLAIVGNGFETFCVEVNVDFNPGQTYYYSVGQTQVDPNGQKLSLGVAYLYHEFATGTLPGYDFANILNLRNTDAGLLQAAIWALEGGQFDAGDALSNPTALLTNPYYQDAYTAFANPNLPANGAFGVEILQLWNNADHTGPAQDQLVLTPDGGSTALLLGAGFSALSLMARRLRK